MLLALLAAAALGHVDARTFQNRKVWICTPAAYDAKRAHDLLVVFDGEQYLEMKLCDDLGDRVAVLVDNGTGGERLAQLANVDAYQRWVATELMPWVRRGWSVTADPHRTTIMGSSAGGLGAAFVAFRHPELFGNVIAQSGAFWRGPEATNSAPFEWLTAQIAAAPRVDVKFVLDAGALETQGPMRGAAPTMIETSTHLAQVLRDKGYDVKLTIVPGGKHAPESWQTRMAELLKPR